ncbi:hypothetical protein ACOMHN_051114 [Nucella lapillus]
MSDIVTFSEIKDKLLARMEKFDGVADTAFFINKVLTWWKILNVKSQYMDIRRNDDLQAAISDPCDERLETLLKFGDMALQMGGKQGKRQKQLTRDTAQAIFHTCNGLVNLCRQLLSTSHQYVLFGQFSTDPLEKEFSKLRQGSGGTYFINVQQIVKKSNINRDKLLLALKADTAAMDVEDQGHACSDCGFAIESNEKACEAVDNLEELEASIFVETKSVLIYIAGYVTRKDPELDEVSQLEQTTFYFEKIACASEERRLEVAKSEELLMLTYNLALPEVQPSTSVSEIPDHAVDDTSAKILQQYHPILLSSYQPIYITGDGSYWTNNNAESINHVLKHMVGWTPQQLRMLVDKLRAMVKTQGDKLRAMVKTQSAEVARALVGLVTCAWLLPMSICRFLVTSGNI